MLTQSSETVLDITCGCWWKHFSSINNAVETLLLMSCGLVMVNLQC